ncbi:MAG: FtsX-like permease family protein, partial [Butyrivibrio sp.]|nr:FtsX-like permease family protein [Butyrivibrio sp.]
MLLIMLQKLWQKRWMNLSLLLGCILLIATAVSFPLYQKAAYDRMLQDEFNRYVAQEGKWPLLIQMNATCQKDKKDTIGKMENYTAEIYRQLGVPEYLTISYYSILKAPITSEIRRDDAENMMLSLSTMTGLSERIRIISGDCYSESGLADDGAIEVIVPQSTMVGKGLLLNETLTFDALKLADGSPVKIRVVGVFTEAEHEQFYFQIHPDSLGEACFMSPELFRTLFTGENAARYNILVMFFDLCDFTQVTAAQVDDINSATTYLCNESAYRSVIREPSYQSILEEYEIKRIRISATLMILQIPVLALLAAFLLMISGQMYELERNEISVIKSRGSSRGQILLLYVYQGLFLTVVGAVFGIPLGGLFSQILGSTRNFLEFDLTSTLNITYTPEVFAYALAAMAVTLLCISLPAVKHSKVSIVHLKQQRALKKRSLWEILFLDVILIGISLYGYYSFHKRLSGISEAVLSGERLDPLLYISSSLFIVGMGLLFLRIQPYVVRLIYFCTKRFCSPAGYISFMENIKNGRKMQLIMLFLIMTISLGMFHATVARTILENALENTSYLDGTDVIMKESWPMMRDAEGTPTGNYIEPDPTKFMSMDFARDYTRVYYDDGAYMRQSKNERLSLTIMGI